MIHRAESLGNNTEMTEGISGAMIGVIVEETPWWNTIFLLSYSAVIILNRESEVHVRYLVDNDFTSVVELAPVHSLAIKFNVRRRLHCKTELGFKIVKQICWQSNEWVTWVDESMFALPDIVLVPVSI